MNIPTEIIKYEIIPRLTFEEMLILLACNAELRMLLSRRTILYKFGIDIWVPADVDINKINLLIFGKYEYVLIHGSQFYQFLVNHLRRIGEVKVYGDTIVTRAIADSKLLNRMFI